MPIYPMFCKSCGHEGELALPMSEAPSSPRGCPSCKAKAYRQDYARKGHEVGMVDGPSSGYYGRETGWPVDPTNPLKVICPSKQAWKDHIKKSRDTASPLRDMT